MHTDPTRVHQVEPTSRHSRKNDQVLLKQYALQKRREMYQTCFSEEKSPFPFNSSFPKLEQNSRPGSLIGQVSYHYDLCLTLQIVLLP